MCLKCRPDNPASIHYKPAPTDDRTEETIGGEYYIAEAVRILDSLDASYTIHELIATARFLEGND